MTTSSAYRRTTATDSQLQPKQTSVPLSHKHKSPLPAILPAHFLCIEPPFSDHVFTTWVVRPSVYRGFAYSVRTERPQRFTGLDRGVLQKLQKEIGECGVPIMDSCWRRKFNFRRKLNVSSVSSIPEELGEVKADGEAVSNGTKPSVIQLF